MASEMIDPMSTSQYSPTGLPGGATSPASGGAWRDPSNWMMPLMMLSAATAGLGKGKGGASGMGMMMPYLIMQMMQGKKPDQTQAPQASQPFQPIYLQQPQAPGYGSMDLLLMDRLLGRGQEQPPTQRHQTPTTQPVAQPPAQPTYRNPSMW